MNKLDLETAVASANTALKVAYETVVRQMDEKSAQGELTTYGQLDGWKEYEKAQSDFQAASRALADWLSNEHA